MTNVTESEVGAGGHPRYTGGMNENTYPLTPATEVSPDSVRVPLGEAETWELVARVTGTYGTAAYEAVNDIADSGKLLVVNPGAKLRVRRDAYGQCVSSLYLDIVEVAQ